MNLDKWFPKNIGIRDPRDSKKRNSMFWNWPRYLFLGGVPGAPMQEGTKGPTERVKSAQGQNAVGPVSERGKVSPG